MIRFELYAMHIHTRWKTCRHASCHSPILVCIILGHLALALCEGGMSPFPLHPAVAATEACVAFCYAAHILLNLWTFGVKQYR